VLTLSSLPLTIGYTPWEGDINFRKEEKQMTKKEAKESLLSVLRDQGVDYSNEGDVVEFEGVSVVLTLNYINVRYDSVSVHYPLSKLSYITVMGGEFWISTIDDHEFTVIYF
jgi:hypothetical protein